MRGSIGRLRAPSSIGTLIGSPTAVKQTHLASFSSFSTFSGNPPGCGRGRSGSSTIPFQADPERASVDPDQPAFPPLGHGGGKHLPSSPFSHSFDHSFVAPQTPSPLPRQPWSGEGRVGSSQPSIGSNNQPLDSTPKRPIFFVKDELGGDGSGSNWILPRPRNPVGGKYLPKSILGVLRGTGRGQPFRQPILEEEENWHVWPSGGVGIGALSGGRVGGGGWSAGIRDGDDVGSGQKRWEGGRGRGRGRARRREWEWNDDERVRDGEDNGEVSEDDYGWWFGPDDDAKAEKFEQKVWPEIRSKFTEVLDEVERKMFPCKKEIYLDSLDINLKIEFDPEYYLDFENDPDTDGRIVVNSKMQMPTYFSEADNDRIGMMITMVMMLRSK